MIVLQPATALLLERAQGQSTHVLQELLDRPPVYWQSHKKWKMKDQLKAMA